MDSATAIGGVRVALAGASLFWQVFEARSRRRLDNRQAELAERQTALAEWQAETEAERLRRSQLPAFEITPAGWATNVGVVDWTIMVKNTGAVVATSPERFDLRPGQELPFSLRFTPDTAHGVAPSEIR